MNALKRAALVAALGMVSACNQGLLGYPGIFDKSGGSCTYPQANGYVACEDFLGSDFNSDVGHSVCVNVNLGTWSQDSCPTAGSLGTCSVEPSGTAEAQTALYTFYASADPDSGVTANALNAETACGRLGGSFAAAH